MKVTLDSNTWRKVASPSTFPNDPFIADYLKIRSALDDKRIEAFLSETMFTLEAIKRKERKQFLADYKAVTTFDVSEDEHGVIAIGFKIGPNPHAHPGTNDILKRHLQDAVNAGFKVLSFPRVAGITNPDIEALKHWLPKAELAKYLDKAFEVGRRILELEAGEFAVRQIAKRYAPEEGFGGLRHAPSSEDGNVASAVAEWADGDSIASHVAMGCDYFCTLDDAKSGGPKSVFTGANLATLKAEFGLEVVTPTELAEKL